MSVLHAHPQIYSLATQDDARSSPTLTDPDMILPNSRTYSPVPLASSSTFSLDMPSPPSNDPDGFYNHPGGSLAEVGVAKAVMMPYRMKPPPPTTIGTNYQSGFERGAPLSDIFEEESTPKSKKARSRSPSPTFANSPTRRSSSQSRKRKNRVSESAKSDSSAGSDFDTSKIMNARLAADLARADDDMTDIEGLESRRNSIITNGDDEMNSLNQRAERILANAKKRLTHMEDNLSKARNSVLISPRSSPVLSEHQPAGGLYRSISQGGDRKLGPGGHLRLKSKPLYPVIKSIGAGHARVLSETSVPSGSSRLSRIPEMRSASALEYGSKADSMFAENSPKQYANGHSPSSSRSLQALQEEDSSPSTNKTTPEAPRGLGIISSSTSKESLQRRGQSSGSPNEVQRSSSQASVRSARELREQMTDLKTKIVDLKTKAQADSLRRMSQQRTPSPFTHAAEQWYAGAPEYKEPGTPINNNAGLGWSPSRADGPTLSSPRSLHDSAVGDGEVQTPVTAAFPDARSDVNTQHLNQNFQQPESRDDNGTSDMKDSRYEDAPEEQEDEDEDPIAASEEEQIYLNEALEESLQDGAPEVPTIPEDILAANGEFERHEDRLDAFDYENMFLHSALGNYFQETRSRSNSESSVETRRAANMTPQPEQEEDEDEPGTANQYESEGLITVHDLEKRTGLHTTAIMEEDEPPTPRALLPPQTPWARTTRSNSMDSVSTMATFQTAKEGGHASDDDEDSPNEILNWGSTSHSAAASPRAAFPASPAKRNPPINGAGKLRSPAKSAKAVEPGQCPQHQPANTEILMASLITLADPTFQMPARANTFADVDKELVIALLRAVGATCNGILRSERRGEVYEARVSRRRLDAARGVLEGVLEFDDEEGEELAEDEEWEGLEYQG